MRTLEQVKADAQRAGKDSNGVPFAPLFTDLEVNYLTFIRSLVRTGWAADDLAADAADFVVVPEYVATAEAGPASVCECCVNGGGAFDCKGG